MNKVTTLAAVAVLVALAGLANAVTVSYTVSGQDPTNYPGPYTAPAGAPHLIDGLGYPGDSVGLVGYTGTLDLTPGTQIQKINTLAWSINYTYAGTDSDPSNDDQGDWLQLQLPVTVGRSMSFNGGPVGALSQSGLLEVNWDNDFLGLSAGLTSTFFVPGYQIDVTPLAVARTGGTNFDGNPAWVQPGQDVMARFDVTAVPEPATMSLLALGGLATLARRKARLR